MKKSVFLVIGLIYILSIAIVGFFGLKMRVYDETIYVEDIKCTATGIKDLGPGGKPGAIEYDFYFATNFREGLTIEVKSEVIPDNATLDGVKYYWEESETNEFTIDDKADKNIALVSFNEPTNLYLFVKSIDGTEIQKTIRLLTI